MPTITEINNATSASLASRAAEIAAAPKSAPKPARKPARKPAPAVVVPPKSTRRALTPKERAARPVTATIAEYVKWLEKELGAATFAKLTKRELAGISITLYGAYQVSPERKAVRDGRPA
jgi:hypothetical protein